MSHPARGPIGTMGIDGKGALERGAGAPWGCDRASAQPPAARPRADCPLRGRTFAEITKALLNPPRASAIGRRHCGVSNQPVAKEAAA
jgi:hypothetical protein